MPFDVLDLQTAAGGVATSGAADVSRTLNLCCPPVLHFGDARREYRAARETAALFDVSDRTQIEVTGSDRQKFLHNFCTNDIKKLLPGQGCEAFVTNVKGKILGHLFVFVGEESLWLETVPGAEEMLIAHLDRYVITEDVALHGRSAEYGELFVSGPGSPDVAKPFSEAAANLALYGHVQSQWNEVPLSIRRVDLLGSPGFLLSVPRGRLPALWQNLAAASQPAGAVAFQALRIEGGFPLYGLDISDDNLAQEASRTRQAISFTKGCYLGQEPIARIDALGHVNRELRGLRLDSTVVPEIGSPVFSNDGQPIGAVTSATLSPTDGKAVALGYLRSKFAAQNTTVRVQTGGSEVPANVFWTE